MAEQTTEAKEEIRCPGCAVHLNSEDPRMIQISIRTDDGEFCSYKCYNEWKHKDKDRK